MVSLITSASKFIIFLLFFMYTVYSFSVLKAENEKKAKSIILKQRIFIFLIHIIAYLIIYLNLNDIKVLIFYPFEFMFLLAYIKFYKIFYPRSNPILTNHFCMFVSIGFIMIVRLNPDKLFRHYSVIFITAAIAFFIPAIMKKGQFLRKLKMIFGVGGLALLSAVFMLGKITYGAKINISISGSTFSPTEIVKLLFVFFIAGVLYNASTIKNIATATAFSAMYVLVLVFSRDLGSALIFFTTYLIMLYVATKRASILLLGAGGFGGAAFIAYKLFSHVQTRINTWTTAFSVIRNDTSQISQALFAISTGGLFGLGLCKGIPTTIPVVISDLIFSAICEELGLLFGICLIFLYISCFLQITDAAMQLVDPFYRLIAIGFGVEFILQALLNIGGTVKFIPLTGITLPLISHGGSSAMEMVLLFAILQGLFILRDTKR